MMRTTRCLFALGLSVSLAAACGDDDGGGTSNGGTGGRAGSAGTGGRAGGAGTGGAAGRGGAAGTGGSTAGTGGSSAGTGGTGGSTAGTGGSAGAGGSTVELPDAGGDAAVVIDSGAPDSGVNGDCPNFATEATGVEAAVGNQNIVISRVEFVSDGARVTFRGVGDGGFNFANPMVLCTGTSLADNCSEGVQDLDPDGALDDNEEVEIFIDAVDPETGELALVSGDPEGVNPIVFAYIAWGDAFASDLETNAVGGGFWTLDDRVPVDGDNTIYTDASEGSTDEAAGYGVCTGDGDSFD
jgi:hypothetical protein